MDQMRKKKMVGVAVKIKIKFFFRCGWWAGLSPTVVRRLHGH
jgi:hypothetical protein